MKDSNAQQKRGFSNNFILIALLFILAISIVNIFMVKNMKTNFKVIKSDNYYYINDDKSVVMFSKVEIQAEDEKSYNRLIENYDKPDEEKRKAYEQFLSKLTENTGRDFKLVSLESSLTTNNNNYTIYVNEKAVIFGFIKDLGNNKYEFSLNSQKMNLANSTLYIYKPKNWEFIETYPQPTEITEDYLLWKDAGEIEFPTIKLERVEK
ncbi:hypothetical protein XO10_00985 [Marinitoga sp. 1135]|uniref:DUF4897 domain-containing protein n=1 Tax=Marinitoga piezophila (strain DSM 14283 / JCM 11233 / KA3) TaxID=443254 RepID=H2J376_MARPK|nr:MULTISPECIES: DUF4897 domain-containing protein [Marinitoga]AEX84594.1 hypothetical protein Marpi_0138 [Marinitoga piezophila KA3]APT75114.1 hypothetical protein LN42_00925 [Marinitoga sp. 1137]NUU94886.1 hypothetical protein [Marinitoga sp. 1135]NUU96824.1 hypothetical protein [Marinitoga sp. 1138]